MTCHTEFLEDSLYTAVRERDAFQGGNVAVQYAAFAQWAYLAIRYVLIMPKCPLPMRERTAWILRYFRELASSGVTIRQAAELGWKKVVLLVCIKTQTLRFYLYLKMAVERFRRMMKGDFR